MDATRLQASSQRWMTTGLAAFSEGDHSFDFAVHHLGVALEHLLKAYLASLDPALVTEASDFDSLLHATGHGDRARRPSTRTKTIGLALAFSRIKKLLPRQITVTDSEFEPVLAARNGVAHAAHFDPAEVRAVLTTCIRIVDPLLAELGVSPKRYWSDYLQLRDQLIDEHTTELQVTMAVKMAQAKAVYLRRIDGLDSEQRRRLVVEFRAANPRSSDNDQCTSCPACEGYGRLHGITDVARLKSTDGEPMPTVVFHASSYDCLLCGLQLEGAELELADLNNEIQLPYKSPFAPHVSDEEWQWHNGYIEHLPKW